MQTLVEQGVVGIVTGIITTVILYTLKVLWSAKITPFLASLSYQGVEIDGHWSGENHESDSETGTSISNECNLFLTQNAHSLKGTFLYKFKSDDKSFSLEFEVKGYIWEGYITLNYTPKDKRVTSYATSLLKLHDGGISLVGIWLFRDVNNETVNQSPMSLLRAKEFADNNINKSLHDKESTQMPGTTQ